MYFLISDQLYDDIWSIIWWGIYSRNLGDMVPYELTVIILYMNDIYVKKLPALQVWLNYSPT